jgi:hypothetical protein
MKTRVRIDREISVKINKQFERRLTSKSPKWVLYNYESNNHLGSKDLNSREAVTGEIPHMSDFFKPIGPNLGVQSQGITQNKKNVQPPKDSLFAGGSGDSVEFSSKSLLGTPSQDDVKAQIGKISNMSPADAQAQLDPSTRFGLSFF